MSSSLQRTWKKLTADKKRFGLMVSLLVVGLLMWGRLLLKQIPKSAVAQPGANQTEPEDMAGVDGFRLDGRKTVSVSLSDVSERNLFSLHDTDYKKMAEKSVPVADKPNLPPKKTENEIRAEFRTQLQEQVAGLSLKTVVLGANPQALINDRIYPMGGQPLPGFVISKVTSRTVTLVTTTDKGTFEFVIKMYRD
jgi:hypothetical protein